MFFKQNAFPLKNASAPRKLLDKNKKIKIRLQIFRTFVKFVIRREMHGTIHLS